MTGYDEFGSAYVVFDGFLLCNGVVIVGCHARQEAMFVGLKLDLPPFFM